MNSFTKFIYSFLSDIRVQFTLTAFSATIATGIAIFSYQSLQRQARTKALKRDLASKPFSKPKSREQVSNGDVNADTFDESLIKEQLARNIAFLGEEGVNKLRNSFVIIVGAGGVGSWAVLMLIRSGVQHVRIIDFDQVTLSSLNRHAVATHADIGRPKVIALQENFKKFAPWAKVEPVTELFTEETAPRLLKGRHIFFKFLIILYIKIVKKLMNSHRKSGFYY